MNEAGKYPIGSTGTLVVVATIALVAAPGLASAIAGAQVDGTVQRSFDVASGGTLTVEASFGHIDVSSGEGDTVAVTVRREVRDRNQDDAEQILAEHRVDISQNDNGVTVRTEVDDDARDRWQDAYRGTPLQVELEIRVPREYNVDLDTSGGHITVSDLTGEVHVDTSGGHIRLGNIEGPVWADTSGGHINLRGSTGTARLHTSGGHIEIGDVDGDVDADTSGGNITIDRAGGTVRAETSGGRIEVREVGGTINASTSGGSIEARITEQPGGDCSLSTSGGSIRVYLAEGIGVDLDAEAGFGGVSVDFDVSGRVRRSAVEGSINGGGPRLRLRTSAGSIRVLRR